jgi:thiol-disulfide isomerase/thioredoxin
MLKTLILIPLAALLVVDTATPAHSLDRIPAFSVRLLDEDRVVSDADLRGVFTLVSFWSTTCPACVAELPHLEAAHARFGDRIEILSISRDRSEEAVRAFRRDRHSMPWLHAVVGPDSEVFDSFGVRGTPHTILIAPDGRIVAQTRHLMGERLLTTLERVAGGCGS